MIFFDGTSSSLHGITECLDEFAMWSGLQMNMNKTELFHVGVNPVESSSISRYGFTVGSLPIRYLGLSLMSRRLKFSEYAPLINKLVSKFNGWAVKMLSFSGRLELLKSVIAGVLKFWMTAFILPHGCIKKIESLCTRFLWSAKIDTRGYAKVAWTTVCLPKSEGGLGLRSLSKWNRVLSLKFVWLLFSASESLWVSWHKQYSLGDKSFWAVQPMYSDSWAWKQILKLRPLARQFIKPILGDGNNISFWFDEWTPLGPLITYLGDTGPRSLSIPLHAKVLDAHDHIAWRIRQPRSDQAVNFHAFLTTTEVPTVNAQNDSFEWNIDGLGANMFSTVKTWEFIRPKAGVKDWAQQIWFKGHIPKHAFTMWITNYDRLPTNSRLAGWGLNVNTSCCLCSVSEETRDHLFLSCEFVSEIWKLVFLKMQPRRGLFNIWSELLSWIKESSASAPSLLRNLVAQATVFHVWKQRNNALHNQVSISPHTTFKCMEREVINTISARWRRRGFDSLMEHWIR